jgi:hypothetical protein
LPARVDDNVRPVLMLLAVWGLNTHADSSLAFKYHFENANAFLDIDAVFTGVL